MIKIEELVLRSRVHQRRVGVSGLAVNALDDMVGSITCKIALLQRTWYIRGWGSFIVYASPGIGRAVTYVSCLMWQTCLPTMSRT